jgi:DNA-directed RNA polymerase subunit RPC12/RpoP
MLDLSTCLKYYMREDIQSKLVDSSNQKEMGTRYLNGHFGKRPDLLQNNADVLELAKQGVSSFHISEEHWKNPLMLSPSLKKKELDSIRTGWDLIIDIDCPDWELSKRIAFVVVKTLKKHNISSIFCKFSGNKGFHIGVPFKSFPSFVEGKPVKLLFPDKVKKMMEYLVYYAKFHYSNEILQGMNSKELSLKLGVDEKDLINEVCSSCHNIRKKTKLKQYYLCEKCGTKCESDTLDSYISCPKCKSLVKRSIDFDNNKCPYCGIKSDIIKEINLHLVLGLDQILISSRHLYRMAYSLHEKSGLASLPINPFSVLAFDKKQAEPLSLIAKYSFLDDSKTIPGEAADFLLKALDFKFDIKEENSLGFSSENVRTNYDVDDIQEKIPIELFPPSIINILKGVKDGRKRALFVLVNFLTCVGWDYPDIDELLHKWNQNNSEPLREREIKSKITYHKTQKKKVLPPNYSNKMYYADLGVLSEEEATGKFKNPVTYSKKKIYFLNKDKKSVKKSDKKHIKKSDEI